jgi:hypothetical protein
MYEGGTAVCVAVIGHFTPSIEQTDDNAAGDENAVYSENLHTGLLRVRATRLPGAWEYRDSHRALYF